MNPRGSRDIRLTRFYGWWYVCIGLGFALLGVRSFLYGSRLWLTLLRWVIAAGFLILGGSTLRGLRR
jgi:hypothetical protein